MTENTQKKRLWGIIILYLRRGSELQDDVTSETTEYTSSQKFFCTLSFTPQQRYSRIRKDFKGSRTVCSLKRLHETDTINISTKQGTPDHRE